MGPLGSNAALPSSYRSMYPAGPLRSTGITPLQHYYEPRRLPASVARAVIDSRPASIQRTTLPGLPSSQHNFQRPPPPITPGRPTVAHACCFTVGSRLHHSWKVGHDQKFNEAESGSRFRIAADVLADTGTPPVGSPLPTSGRLRVKTGNLHGKLLSAYKLCQASLGVPGSTGLTGSDRFSSCASCESRQGSCPLRKCLLLLPFPAAVCRGTL